MMKKPINLIILMFMTLFAAAQSKEETKVAEAVEKMRLAMISGNKADLESIAANNLTYGHSNGKVQDKAEFVDALATKKSDFLKIDLLDQSITVAGHTAIVRHQLKADSNDGGIPGKVNLGIVLVWEKQGDAWKLLARRAFKLSY
jgi:ketosteroid isomerase-like protein